MKPGLKLFFAIALIFVALNSASAEMLSLKQAVNIALKENPALRASAWTVQAQEYNVKGSKGYLYPRFRIEEKFSRTNNPTYSFMSKLNQERFAQEDFRISSLNDPDDISGFQTSISFEQPLFVPKLYLGIEMSGRELDAKKAEYKRKKEDVALKVIRAFLMVKTSGEYLRAAQAGTKDAEEHKRIALARYDAGTGLYSDVLRAEVAVKKSEANMIMSESNLDIAKRTLGLLLGRTEPVDITDDKPVFPIDSINVYLDAAKNREDLNAMRLRHDNSLKAVKLEKSVFIPEAGIGGSYNLYDHKRPFASEGESYILMGFLRWNLFDASQYHKISEAKAKARAVEEGLSGLEKEINFRINEAYTRVKEKERNLFLSRAVVKESEEALRLVRTRYENSLAPMVDLLDTQTMLDNARAGAAAAENEYLNSIVALYYQSGILLEIMN